MALHRRGYKFVANNPRYVEDAGEHVGFLALTGNHDRAVRLLQKHLPVAWSSSNLLNRYLFCLPCATLCERLERAGVGRKKLLLPAGVPGKDDRGAYDFAELGAYFRAEAAELAARFDARNGNDYYARKLADNAARHALACDVPFKA